MTDTNFAYLPDPKTKGAAMIAQTDCPPCNKQFHVRFDISQEEIPKMIEHLQKKQEKPAKRKKK
jgi:hypothetical protein